MQCKELRALGHCGPAYWGGGGKYLLTLPGFLFPPGHQLLADVLQNGLKKIGVSGQFNNELDREFTS